MDDGKKDGAASAASTAADSERSAAEGFCDAILPAMIEDLGRSCARVSAVVQLYVKGDRADLARVVTLDGQPSVREGEDPDADLVLAIDERALPALLAGALDVEDALARGHLEAEGDLDVLARLAALFDGGASPLATRLLAFGARASGPGGA